ncbi:DUF4198 domain-containing protein [Rhizobium sp. TRM95796]|uniref:DUF4198 domain-containing protein n=1 Tax=Rhizobium sp. TRM95796 TaxID=2979862 RepID=UPI0021E78636|nr:DUF4198 domain-containing protein [Rhizobium sp. TRM95796]MCV3768607.1 DUF4198 domain-containing protein [Rhizobium sp. TRM95796]
MDAFRHLRSLSRLAALPLVLFADPVHGHDFWLEPHETKPLAGKVMPVGLAVGERFIGDPLPRPARGVDRFEFLYPGGVSRVTGGAGEVPAGIVVVPSPATGLLVYVGGGASVELSLADFHRYADAYGLREAIEAQGGWSEPGPFRECFYRYAKSAIGGADAGHLSAAAQDWAFEITLSTLPNAKSGVVGGRLLSRGEPVAGALVRLYRKGDSRLDLKARSNADGGFAVPLPGPGLWGVMAVTINRAGFFSSCDWESRWASFIFDWRSMTP